MRIVQDTNVFISALMSSDGASGACVERCLDGRDKPVFGPALLAEYMEKVEDDSLWDGIDIEERRTLLDALMTFSEWQNVWFTWRPNLPDPADDHVYELALAAHVERLVTWNLKDFARGERMFSNPRILTPAQHLKSL